MQREGIKGWKGGKGERKGDGCEREDSNAVKCHETRVPLDLWFKWSFVRDAGDRMGESNGTKTRALIAL